MSNSNSEIIIRNTADYLNANLDGEMVLMQVATAEYLGMDKTTTHIWELLEEEMSLYQLVEKLISIYDVDAGTCKDDIQPVLEDMLKKQLVCLKEDI